MTDKTDMTRPYWNMEVESKLNTDEMREFQLKKLPGAMEAAYKVPLQRRRFDEAGVKPGDIKTFDDMANAFGVYGQNELRKVVMEVGMDVDALLKLALGEEAYNDLVCIATTSGTTGIPTPYPICRTGLPLAREMNSRIAWRANIRPRDRIILAFGLSMFLAGSPTLLTFEEFGASIIPIGAESGSARIFQFAKLLKGNVLMCTPSLALHLIEKEKQYMGKVGVKGLNLKTILCGGEPGAGIPEVRQQIEEAYGCPLYDAGAGAGVSCNHPEYQGMHWIADDFVYYEIVDPDTGKAVPMEDGATGLGTFTSLTSEPGLIGGIRMTMGDIHEVKTSPCPCGLSGFRYKIVGRTDDMLKVKGVMVYPAQIQGVIHSMVPKVTGEFRIVLDEPPPRVVPPVKLKIEHGRDVSKDDLAGLTEELAEKMHREIKIRPEITWLEPDSLERFDQKTKLIEKAYEKKK